MEQTDALMKSIQPRRDRVFRWLLTYLIQPAGGNHSTNYRDRSFDVIWCLRVDSDDIALRHISLRKLKMARQ